MKIFLSIITLFFPQMILDAIFTIKQLNYIVWIISVFLILTFFVNIISQYILKISSNQRTITFNLFQVDLANRMMSAKLEELESRDFLDLKAKAEQYIYGGGQGFASVLENSFVKCTTKRSSTLLFLLYSII